MLVSSRPHAFKAQNQATSRRTFDRKLKTIKTGREFIRRRKGCLRNGWTVKTDYGFFPGIGLREETLCIKRDFIVPHFRGQCGCALCRNCQDPGGNFPVGPDVYPVFRPLQNGAGKIHLCTVETGAQSCE